MIDLFIASGAVLIFAVICGGLIYFGNKAQRSNRDD